MTVLTSGREHPVLQAVLAHVGKQGEVEFIDDLPRHRICQQKELERIEWANRYDAAVRASGQVVFDWDTLSGEIAYGGEIEKLLGFTVDEMVGGMQRLRRTVHPEDCTIFRADRGGLADTRFRWITRSARRARTGRRSPSTNGCSMHRQGQLGRMVGFKNVTKERRAQKAILLALNELDERVTERTAELAKAKSQLKNSALRQAAVRRLLHNRRSPASSGELMSDAAKIAHEMLPCDCISVLHYELQKRRAFQSDGADRWQTRSAASGSRRNQLTSGYTIETGEPVVSNDLETERRFQLGEARAAGAKSAITACIKDGEHPLGVLALLAFTENLLDDDASFVQSIATFSMNLIDPESRGLHIRKARADAEAGNRAKSEFRSESAMSCARR